MRTIVDLRDEQVSRLDKLCAAENISRAEAVRRAVDKMLKSSGPSTARAGFGLWKHKRLNSRKFVSALRAEWNKR